MINVIIPMAGEGSRFSRAGYELPKPFVDVAGRPMIYRVLENLAYPDARYFLLARREHMLAHHRLVKDIEGAFDVVFVPIDRLTEGTACTILFARRHINSSEPLLIANSDQIVDVRIGEFIDDCFRRRLDGSILTFVDTERNPKWSFARTGRDGLVSEVREKDPISEFATVGIYFFANGADFVDAAVEMIICGDRVNGEFYTCPAYNYAIAAGRKIGIFNISASSMHGIGTPEDLSNFLRLGLYP